MLFVERRELCLLIVSLCASILKLISSGLCSLKLKEGKNGLRLVNCCWRLPGRGRDLTV